MTQHAPTKMTLPEKIVVYRVEQRDGAFVVVENAHDRPVPRHDEVLVSVAAAGVGTWDDWFLSTGSKASSRPPVGMAFSGTVAALGPGVKELFVGDAVYGVCTQWAAKACSNYAIASIAAIARKPWSIGDVEAASIPVVAVTAWQALFDHAKLRRGQRVLILGAAGNVGGYAVQFAHSAGLYTIGTARPQEMRALRRLGADLVIDIDAASFEAEIAQVDAIIDLVGGSVQRRSFGVLNRTGVLVSTVSEPDRKMATSKGVRTIHSVVDVNTQQLLDIAQMVDADGLRTQVAEVLPMSDAIRVHDMLAGSRGYQRGQIVLVTD